MDDESSHAESGVDDGTPTVGAVPEAVGDDDRAELCAEVELLRDQLLRLRADTDNYRKRMERTTQDLSRQARREILLIILGIADDLDRALAATGNRDADDSLRDGVELTLTRVHDALRGHGVRPLEGTGSFDPRWHEAVGTIEHNDWEDGAVVEEVQRGYWWGDEVLRPARVMVAVAPSE